MFAFFTLSCVSNKLCDELIPNQEVLTNICKIHSFRSNFESKQAKGIILPSSRRKIISYGDSVC
jgi:hypothetical protein